MSFLRRYHATGRADVRRFAFDAAVLAFREIIPHAQLVRAMQADAYVLGYVLARLAGLITHACADAGLQIDTDALCEAVQRDFLGANAPILLAQAAILAGDTEYRAGRRDGQEQCDFLFGKRDVRAHPRYADAVALERMVSALRPGTRFRGADVAVAQQLEKYTFGVYLLRHRGAAVLVDWTSAEPRV